MQRILILVGATLLIAGIGWPWLSRFPLGHLPGDLVIERPGFRFYFPVTTLIIVSALLSILARLWRR